MPFRLVVDPTDTHVRFIPIASTAFTVGDMLELDIGATTWTAANASTEHWQLKAVAIETVASTATEIKCILVNEGQIWDTDLDNNSNSAHNGDRMLLSATAGQVNNTGTDNTSEEACAVQVAPVGAAADQRALMRIVGGTGINPDAA